MCPLNELDREKHCYAHYPLPHSTYTRYIGKGGGVVVTVPSLISRGLIFRKGY